MINRQFLRSLLILVLLFNASSVYGQGPSWLWAKDASPVGGGIGQSIAVDGAGNAYVVGNFLEDSIALGNSLFFNDDTSGSTSDVFIAKYDPSGQVLWVRHVGGNASEEGTGIVVDAAGNVFVCGNFSSDTVSFDNTYYMSNSSLDLDIFVVKYDTYGNVLWMNKAGGTMFDRVMDIALDSGNNFYLTGFSRSPLIHFGTVTLNGTGYNDVFIVKYTSSGIVSWAKKSGGISSNACGKNLATDNAGNIYLAGYFQIYITFDSDTLFDTGSLDMFLVKYDSGGNLLWTRSFAGSGIDNATGLAVDNVGNLFLTGWFKGPALTLDTVLLTNYTSTNLQIDLFIAKLDSGGSVLWARSAGGNSDDFSNDVRTDNFGNAYLVGEFSSDTLNIGSITLLNSNSTKVIVLRYDALGNVDWVCNSICQTYMNLGLDIAVNNDGIAFITGAYNNTIDFGSNNLNSQLDGFYIAKLDSSSFTSIPEFSSAGNNLIIAPNPSSGQFILNCPDGIERVEIFDVTGKAVYYSEYDGTSKLLTIDITNISPGMYFVKAHVKGQYFTSKLVKVTSDK